MAFNLLSNIWSCGYILQLGALKNENRKLKAELHLIKKFLEEAKRKTNEKFD